ncbi:MAG: hypothetical protein HOO96_35200 [Polyangiaceae bacterium]|nr:hypothetical protein [Polyangiaceae bacterium]
MRTLAIISLLGLTVSAFACSDTDPNRDGNFNQVRVGESSSSSGGASSSGGSSGTTSSSGGSSGASSGTNPQGPTFTLQATDLTGELYDYKTATIMVVPANGFTGDVTLTLEGMGTDIIGAKLDKTTLKPNETATLTAASTKGGAVPFVVKGTSGSIIVPRTVTFTAQKVLTLRSKMGVGTAPVPGSNFMNSVAAGTVDTFTVTNALPLTVRYINLDGAGHIFHTSDEANFAHGNRQVAIAQNGVDPTVRTIAAADIRVGYIHDLVQAQTSWRLDVK